MAYAAHGDLEDKLGGPDFTADTYPTDTQVDNLLVEIGGMWDGLQQQDVDIEIPTEHVKQAVMAAGAYQVEQLRADEPVDQLVIIKILKNFMTFKGKAYMSYEQAYPTSSGKW